MHLQETIPGWLDALLALPADQKVMVKAFDAGALKDAALAWTGAGRMRENLVTVLRHADFDTAPRNATWAEAVEHNTRQFFRFVDGTYLRELAPYVDRVSEANEYAAASTWHDPDKGAGVLRHMEAVNWVWATKFRGQIVTNPNDGGTGLIPASCKLAFYAGTVSQPIPKRAYELSVEHDHDLDYHAYCYVKNGVRPPFCWPEHSGRWNTHEQEYGIHRATYLWGEMGPYLSTHWGWRHPECLNGNGPALLRVMREFYTDVAETAAYREGRITGQGAYFTTRRNPVFDQGWYWYDYNREDLLAVNQLVRDVWKPGEFEMADLVKVRFHLNEATALTYDHPLRDKTNQQVINLFNSALGGFDELARAVPGWQQSMAGSPAIRAAAYTGPAVEAMTALTLAERHKLIAALGT